MRKPHLYPPNMPVTRLTHFANAADVDTVIVDGRMLMRGREALGVDEDAILDDASTELALALERSGLGHLTKEPDELWNVNRRGAGGRAADR